MGLVSSLDLITGKLGSGDVFAIVPKGNIRSSSLYVNLLKYLVSRKYGVVYVCVDRPFSSIKKVLDKDKFNYKSVLFIDTATLISSKAAVESRCRYVRSPENLTDLSIALSEAISSFAGAQSCVIIDSASTLFVYNKVSTVAKFIHLSSAKVRQYNSKCLIFFNNSCSYELLEDQIESFVDEVIRISGG